MGGSQHLKDPQLKSLQCCYTILLALYSVIDNLESVKSCGMHGNMGYVGAWVTLVCGLCGPNFYLGYIGNKGQNIFYLGQCFTLVIIYMWVNFSCESLIFLSQSKFFLGVYIFVWVIFRGGSKKILIGAFTIIS